MSTIETQNAEFDAARELAKQIRRIEMTPIVDDDYPAVRHDYERAVRAFLEACETNSRESSKRGRMIDDPGLLATKEDMDSVSVLCRWTERAGRKGVYDCPDCKSWTANLPRYRNSVCSVKDRRKSDRRGVDRRSA